MTCLAWSASSHAWTITTIAGGPPYAGSNVEQHRFGVLAHAVADGRGNVFVSDPTNDRVLKVVLATSTVTVAVGLGFKGFFGDGTAAELALLDHPSGLAVDASGNLYIADTGNRRVRKVDHATGVITTVAGNGTKTPLGDGGLAVNAGFRRPIGIALDAAGNLFISDSEQSRIRKVIAATGVISTYAGMDFKGFTGDGGPATAARFANPTALAIDSAGNLFVADSVNHRVRRIGVNGVVQTVAGNGVKGNGGLGGAATSASLNYPTGLAINAQGDLLIADSNNHRVLKLSAGNLVAHAGTGTRGSGGDGGPALSATLRYPAGLAINQDGKLIIADGGNQRVRVIDATTGTISSLIGNHISNISNAPFVPDQLVAPTGVAVDSLGNVYVADPEAHAVRRIAAGTGAITTVAGTGSHGFTGDGGPANLAMLSSPSAVAVNAAGDLYIADTGNQRIRKVIISTNTITTVAGDGVSGFFGDGTLATSASLAYPASVAIGPNGDLFIGDTMNHRVRRVSAATGVIETIAGSGTAGSAGVNGLAINAQLDKPIGLAVDAQGNVYIGTADDMTMVRRVEANTAMLTAVAISDGWTSYKPRAVGLAIGADGALYSVHSQTGTVFRTRQGSQTELIAGVSLSRGYTGDGGDARLARFNQPSGIAVDGNGNIYIADSLNRAVRKLASGPPEAPTNIYAEYFSQRITIRFTPSLDNGYAVIDYTATCGSQTATSATAAIVFNNMPRGVTYNCTLAARNSRGTGPAASFSVGRPILPPSAPTNVVATGGIEEILLNFTPPADDGGAPVTGYQVQATSGQIIQTFYNPMLPLRLVPPNILVGQSYQFLVRPINQAGTGDAAWASNSAMAIGPPSSPYLTATAGDQSVILESPGGSNGGSSIIDVTVTCSSTSPASTLHVTRAAFPVTVSGLTNGVTYTCTATARNSVGSSPVSAPTAPFTPRGYQTISFAEIPSKSYGDPPFTLLAIGGASGNPVLFTTLTPSVCATGGTNGEIVTIVDAGACSIRASQAGNAAYVAALDVNRTVWIRGMPQYISFSPLPHMHLSTPAFQLTATGGASGRPVTFASTTPNVCTTTGPNGSTATLVSVGYCVLELRQAGGSGHDPATEVYQRFHVFLTPPTVFSQTIVFNQPGDNQLTATPITLSAYGMTQNAFGTPTPSYIPVTYSSMTPAVCATTGHYGRTLNLLQLGTCTVRAELAGDYYHDVAPPVVRSFQVVEGIPQNITFAALTDRAFSPTPFVVSATGGGSGNPVVFTSDTPAVCMIGSYDNMVYMLTVGTCTIRAEQAGNASHAPASPVYRSFQVTQAPPQVITFNALNDRVLSATPFQLSATGGASGNPVVFTSQTPATCTSGGINGGTVQMLALGTCAIQADQAGNANYPQAAPVTRSFQIVDKYAQNISFAGLNDRLLSATSFQVSAGGGGSGNPVVFTSQTLSTCTTGGVHGATVQLLALGTCTIQADQAGNASYQPATPVTRSFQIVQGTAQTITFATLEDRVMSVTPFTVTATGGASGNPVTFSSSTPSTCSTGGTNGSQITTITLGTCTIVARQAGGGIYTAAPDVTRSFAILPPPNSASVTVAIVGGGAVISSPAGISCVATCTGAFPVGQAVTLTASIGPGLIFTGWSGACSGSATTCTFTPITNGNFNVTATFAQQPRTTVAVSVTGGGSVSIFFAGMGIPCSANCSTTVPTGQTVTLTASAGSGWIFSGWGGSVCSGTGNTCNITTTTAGTLNVTATFSHPPPATWRRLNFNGDGQADILWRNPGTGENYLYPMSGTTILAGEGSIRSVAAPWNVAGVGDFDGDGQADILWRNTSTGENYMYPMNGTAILGTEGHIRSVPTNWIVGGIGDFDGDGKADILWRNTTTGENYLYFMDGKTIKATEGYIRSVPTAWVPATVGDFDGDGKADILWRNTTTGENYIYPMNGVAIKATEGNIRSVPIGWIVAGSGDFDGDGRADILWRNTTTGENYLYPMNGTAILATEGNIRTVPTTWIPASVADFDGDGKVDILWRNTTTGENYIYPMDGKTIKATEGFIRSTPLAWGVVSK